MNKTFEKRSEANAARSAKAADVFNKLEAEFTAAAGADRELWNDLTAEIDRLQALADEVQDRGTRTEQRAHRVRELFL